jgi:CheY-like chemotaxis protein
MGTQSKFKILIIDDDPSNLENMDSALLKKGYEVKSESQDLIRAMMNENPSGQLIVDKKGMIRFANRAAEDIMCSANTTLTGKQFLHSLDKGEKKEIILFDQDKNERIAEVHAVEVMYEGEKMSLIFFNEITQKKRLQAVISDYGKRNARAQTLGKIGHWEYNYLTKEFRASDETLKICNIEVKKSKLELKDFVARIAHRKLTLESFTRLAKKYNYLSYIFEI